ncbi:MAG: hypothetical protein ACO3C1_07655 [Ilumatobacteraceae bacterium]
MSSHPLRATHVVSLTLIALAVATGCSGADETVATTVDVATTTSAPVSGESTTTTAAEVPSSSSSTPSSSTSSTSTLPAVEGLELSASGLGGALFGAEADGVVDYVGAILGPFDSDSGWVDPFAIGAACPGSEVRFVTWDDLQLFFTDESSAASGLRHFAAFHYGPALGSAPSPYGLLTAEGIGLGSSVQSLRATYTRGVMAPGDEVLGPRFVITDGLTAFVTETVSAGVVQSFAGGFGCGE